MLKPILCALAAGLLLAACGTTSGGPPKLAEPMGVLGAPDAPKQEVRQDYRLQPSDVIEISVFDFAELNRTVQVSATGNISLALIGEVRASGRTAAELSGDIAAKYGVKYLRNPQVAVLVKQAHLETYTVDGSVTQPGVYPVTERMSLLKAIAVARGTDALANPKQVVVFRTVNNERVYGMFDLNLIRNGQQVDPAIYPNDTIVVPSSQARRTLRDIVGVTPLLPLLLIP